MLFVLVMVLAAASGFGCGLFVAIWIMANEPLPDRSLRPFADADLHKKSA